jgi:hypothetical protein
MALQAGGMVLRQRNLQIREIIGYRPETGSVGPACSGVLLEHSLADVYNRVDELVDTIFRSEMARASGEAARLYQRSTEVLLTSEEVDEHGHNPLATG